MTHGLTDRHHRIIDYLRVSITDLCNLRCIYCRPPDGVKLVAHGDILRYEEILTIVRTAIDLGIKKVRVTGGEPLVRRGAVDFIRRLTSMKELQDVGLTTNGILLSRYARELKDAGLKRVNVSLDTLRRDVFASVTGYDGLHTVLEGIDAALDEGFDPVKINVVLLENINEADIPAFARMTMDKPTDVRFIEKMPFGSDHEPASAPDSFDARKVIGIIEETVGPLLPAERGPLDGPATMLKLEGALGKIGVIDAVTGHFCGTCNRLRLTAQGFLRPCLRSDNEIDIKTAVRAGASRDELTEIIRRAVESKPAGHPIDNRPVKVGMNSIGG